MADKKEKRQLISAKYSKRSPFGEFWHRFSQNKLAVIGLAFLILLALECCFADVIFDYKTDVIGYTMKDRLQGPSAAHWFGTDDMGRDIFSRVMYGARYSLLIAIATVALSLVVGVTLGAVAGFLGGKADLYIFRVLDIVGSIPGLMMGIIVVSALGQSTQSLVIAMAISGTIPTARIARTSVMTVKNNEYVESSRSIGMPMGAIILKHILPNCLSVIIISTALQIPSAIFTESFLSFVGIGVKAPMPSLGSLANAAREGLQSYPYKLIFPAIVICLIVLSLNLLGDGLRDAFDPKLKR